MRAISVLGLLLAAMSVLATVAAGSASALFFKSLNASELFTVNETGSVRFFEATNKEKVECTATLAHGFILSGTDKAAQILYLYHGCKSGSGFACNSSGQPSGLIETNELKGLLVTLLASEGGKPALLLSPEGGALYAKFECAGGLVTVTGEGNVLGEFTGRVNELIKNLNFKFTCSGTAGKPTLTSYETEAGKFSAELTSSAEGLLKWTKLESCKNSEDELKLADEGEIVN